MPLTGLSQLTCMYAETHFHFACSLYIDQMYRVACDPRRPTCLNNKLLWHKYAWIILLFDMLSLKIDSCEEKHQSTALYFCSQFAAQENTNDQVYIRVLWSSQVTLWYSNVLDGWFQLAWTQYRRLDLSQPNNRFASAVLLPCGFCWCSVHCMGNRNWLATLMYICVSLLSNFTALTNWHIYWMFLVSIFVAHILPSYHSGLYLFQT